MSNPFLDSLFVASQYVLPQHALSRTVGKLARSETPWLKNNLIKAFSKRFGISLAEAEIEDINEFSSFNAFFTRALKADARPIDADNNSICSPADGAVSQCGKLQTDSVLQAKGSYYSATQLLGGDEALAQEFTDGNFATIYLSPKDYHRVHMPFTGTLRRMIYIPGKLFSVNNATANQVPDLFARNERAVCIFDTDAGPMAVILVGAMIVAAIETVFAGQLAPQTEQITDYQDQNITLKKGEELGRFLLGSTVILLYPKDAIAWESHLTAGQTLKMGTRIGSLKQAKHKRPD